MQGTEGRMQQRLLSNLVFGFIFVILCCGQLLASGEPDESRSVTISKPQLRKTVHHDLSLPLRDMIPTPSKAGVIRVVPNRMIPIDVDHNAPVSAGSIDSVMQMSPGFSAPTPGSANYLGVGNGFSGPQGTWTVNVAPPDPVMDVGPNHIVQAVNSGFAVFNKTGTVLYGPVNLNTLWSGFGGGCQTNNDGDPTINYDQMANRWMIAQFAVSTTPYLECVAISQTADPTGAWYRYSYSFGSTNFNDYPHVGVWPDGYYITYNIFGATYFGEVCAHDRSKMINGQANTMQCFTTSSNVQGLLSADMDGTTQPPAGAPNYVLRFGSNQLQMWKFHVDWTTPANSTFTGPTNISVASFTPSCSSSTRGACVPQANGGTSYYLEALADRLMNRVAYRNFGTHEALTVAHSVGGQTAANVRWYELRSPNATPTMFQSGTYAPDTSWRWVASTAMDQQGNMAMGYSVSSSSISPTIRVTGRLATDAAGTMGTEVDILGSIAHASQIGTYGTPAKPLQRWGDYSAMVVDPSDDCTFWYTTEYIPTQGIFNWATRIASFKFSSCGGVADTTPPTTSLTAPAGGSTVSGSVTVSANASDNIGVSRVEFYAGASLLGSDTTSPYSISWNTTSVVNGTYSLTSKAFDAANNSATSAAVSVTVNNIAGPPALTATYNSTTKAPVCGSGGKSCSSGTLLTGRGTMSPAEANQPNTINTSCADGNSGTFHTDESLDALSVATNDATAFAGGKVVTVSATAWCWGTADKVDLYYTNNTTTPSWTLIGTQTCSAAGARTFTATYTLPSSGTSQAVRGTFRYNGTASACGTNSGYDDHDDLVFGVTQASDTTAPTTSITSPAAGATVSGTITISANASDNVGVSRVEFYRGTTLLGTDTTSPYSVSWNTTTVVNGSYSLTSKAFDAANNSATSAAVSVTVNNIAAPPALTATYSTTLKAPTCASGGKSCDSGSSLLNGRGTMSPAEPNQPNTINNSCADGNSGTYHSDESLDRLSIATSDATALAAGKTVTITVTAYCYSSADKLDLYRTATASTPSWTLIGTQACTVAGAKTFTATYTLPAGAQQAIRGTFRYNGTASACGTNSGYDDHDDLVFGVN